jgi:ankyrin repeat protein
VKLAQLLIENRADINLFDNDGLTPLHHACMRGKQRTAHLLIKNGADVNIVDNEGETALKYACREGLFSVVKLLMAKASDASSHLNVCLPCYSGKTACKRAKITKKKRLNGECNSDNKKGKGQ